MTMNNKLGNHRYSADYMVEVKVKHDTSLSYLCWNDWHTGMMVTVYIDGQSTKSGS